MASRAVVLCLFALFAVALLANGVDAGKGGKWKVVSKEEEEEPKCKEVCKDECKTEEVCEDKDYEECKDVVVKTKKKVCKEVEAASKGKGRKLTGKGKGFIVINKAPAKEECEEKEVEETKEKCETKTKEVCHDEEKCKEVCKEVCEEEEEEAPAPSKKIVVVKGKGL